MADVIARKMNKNGRYVVLRSVNTPDYPTADYLIINGLTLPEADEKHWKVVNDSVQEMTQSEKDDPLQLYKAQEGITELETIELRGPNFYYDYGAYQSAVATEGVTVIGVDTTGNWTDLTSQQQTDSENGFTSLSSEQQRILCEALAVPQPLRKIYHGDDEAGRVADAKMCFAYLGKTEEEMKGWRQIRMAKVRATFLSRFECRKHVDEIISDITGADNDIRGKSVKADLTRLYIENGFVGSSYNNAEGPEDYLKSQGTYSANGFQEKTFDPVGYSANKSGFANDVISFLKDGTGPLSF